MNFGSSMITLVLVVALVVVLLSWLTRPATRLGTSAGWLWRGLWPDFGRFTTGRATTQTFHMLVSAMLVFGVAVIAWSAGAGVLRALWLAGAKPEDIKGTIDSFGSFVCGKTCTLNWVFVAVEITRAVGGVLVLGMAAGLGGALLGFLFGIPRPVSASESPPAAAGGMVPTSGASRRSAKKAWELSTNLTQVSDWLTKIVVGVGLVEAKNGARAFDDTMNQAALWLFNMRHGSPTLIAASVLGSVVFGFLFAYLYTQLIITRLIVATDQDIADPGAAAATVMQGIKSWDEDLVPRISRSMIAPDTTESPTRQQVIAALAYNAIPFDELIAKPDITRDEVLNWARAKAVLNDYEAAALGYIFLLGMRAS